MKKARKPDQQGRQAHTSLPVGRNADGARIRHRQRLSVITARLTGAQVFFTPHWEGDDAGPPIQAGMADGADGKGSASLRLIARYRCHCGSSHDGETLLLAVALLLGSPIEGCTMRMPARGLIPVAGKVRRFMSRQGRSGVRFETTSALRSSWSDYRFGIK